MPRYRISYEIDLESDDEARSEADALALERGVYRETVRIEKQQSYFTALNDDTTEPTS